MVYEFFSCFTDIPRGSSPYKPQKLVAYCLIILWLISSLSCFHHSWSSTVLLTINRSRDIRWALPGNIDSPSYNLSQRWCVKLIWISFCWDILTTVRHHGYCSTIAGAEEYFSYLLFKVISFSHHLLNFPSLYQNPWLWTNPRHSQRTL